MYVYSVFCLHGSADICVGTNFIRDVLRQKRVTLDIRKLIMLSESFALVSPPFIRRIYNAYLYCCRICVVSYFWRYMLANICRHKRCVCLLHSKNTCLLEVLYNSLVFSVKQSPVYFLRILKFKITFFA